MCGIAGVVGPGAGALADRVAEMIRALGHRGPDEHGVAVFDDAVLGTARLSIVDLAGGHQPLFGPGRRTTLVCNGEIYGHPAIRDAHPNYPFTTGSDCEAALALHDRYGQDFLTRLPGTFALALWDESDRSLILARDRFGERPLYHATTRDGLLVFASESKALLASGLIDASPDPDSVAEMLRQGYVPPGRSIWRGIESLPPAHCLRWTRGAADPAARRWWAPPDPTHRMGADEAVEWFGAELDRAVQDQLAADVPVGAFLSGGIDSSTIASIAARHRSGLHAFCFDMPGESEVAHAQQVADRHEIQLHVLSPDPGDVADQLADLPRIWDEPFGDSSALPTSMLCRFAREHVTVVLTGDGADELLGGYLAWARGYLDAGQGTVQERRGRCSRLLARWSRASVGHPQRPAVADRYAAFRQYFVADELGAMGLPARDARHVDTSPYVHGGLDDLTRFDLDHYLPGDILVKTDRASMAVGLEVRAPFLDVAVAEGCLALPAHHKFDADRDKLLLRRATANLLPPAVIDRAKQGFGAPMSRWLALPGVRELKLAHLSDPSSALFDLVDHQAVSSYVAADDQRTWNLLMLGLWWDHARRGVTTP